MLTFDKNRKLVVGLSHLLPLPGTPFHEPGNLEKSVQKAVADSLALQRGGADGCLLQTVDKVYPRGDDTDYARVSAMTVIAHEVRQAVGPDFLLGVQLMWNCVTPSLAVAKVCGADFIRCTAMVGATPSPFGTVEADPLKVQSYRKQLGAQDITMIAEISGYHFAQGGDADLGSLKQLAWNARMVGADALEIVHKDEETNNRMADAISKMGMPVVLGGGTDLSNVKRRLSHADMALVGSCFEGGKWGGPIVEEIVREYVGLAR